LENIFLREAAKRMIDLAIAYWIYPGVSKVSAVFADDKLTLSTLCLQSFKKALGPLKVKDLGLTGWMSGNL
jgi:hypothetical protein